jgi:hypothetical protein
MFIKISKKSRLAFTLAEVLIASTLFGIAGLALGSVYLFSTRTFGALANYATLDQNNRNAMDGMTKEIRECMQIIAVDTNAEGNVIAIHLINNTGDNVTYSFDSASQDLTRTLVPNGSKVPLPAQVLVPNCQILSFTVGQRTPDNTNFDTYPWTPGSSIQVLDMTWKAWKRIPGTQVGTSEEIQTAHVVIRNQHFVQYGIVETY